MTAISCNQRNGGHRKALCPGTPQGPAWYQCHKWDPKETNSWGANDPQNHVWYPFEPLVLSASVNHLLPFGLVSLLLDSRSLLLIELSNFIRDLFFSKASSFWWVFICFLNLWFWSMGSQSSKLSQEGPPSGILASFIFKNYGPSSCAFLTIWINLTKDNLELQWPLWGIFWSP